MPDKHYTPRAVADRMVEAALERGLPAQGRAVDFAAGEGALLEAAAKHLDYKMFATDIDVRTVHALKQRYPEWTVGRCDIFSSRSRAASGAWAAARDADLVLLNPPYSYRGGGLRKIAISGEALWASPASCAFLLGAHLVRQGGVVIGVLPANARRGEKDAAVWAALATKGAIEPLETLSRGTFAGEFATTEVVRWVKGGRTRGLEPVARPAASKAECRCLELVRGTLPVHGLASRQPGTTRFLHTTDLRDGSIEASGLRAAATHATPGPFVLIPRVGVPHRGKLVARLTPAVLSDCLLALRPVQPEQVDLLLRELSQDIGGLRALYSGTCARYVTTKRLSAYLAGQHAWAVRSARVRDAPARDCQCALW